MAVAKCGLPRSERPVRVNLRPGGTNSGPKQELSRVWPRTIETRGFLRRKTAFVMVLQLALSAQQEWSWPNHPQVLVQVIEAIGRVQFRNGIQEVRRSASILRHQLVGHISLREPLIC